MKLREGWEGSANGIVGLFGCELLNIYQSVLVGGHKLMSHFYPNFAETNPIGY